MCGVAGWLGHVTNGAPVAERIMRLLHHRGPDAENFRQWPEATLIHTRLSIIDLSPAGAQPMPNKEGTIWVVFNGEIYNHHELRRHLKDLGHEFRGHSDTEVLTYLYEEEGEEFVTRLRGMFAFAIWDTRDKTLLLARDRFGIKPLFYAPGHTVLAFASEINPLLQVPGLNLQVDPQAIHDFSSLFYIPAPDTLYKGIKALKPGELLKARIANGNVSWQTRIYHHWAISPNPALTLNGAASRANELLENAVGQQLESDVSLGSLLSGGIDSSLVSAAAQASINGGLRTFNVQFPHGDYDETWAAKAVAEYIGSEHLSLDINDSRGTWDSITSLLRHAGQPFADTSLFAVSAISKLMREHVTVALSGDGGDEGFGGYNLYWQLARIARSQLLPAPLWRGASTVFESLGLFGGLREQWPDRIRDLAGADNTSILQNLFCWIRERETARLCHDMDVHPVRRFFEREWAYHLPRNAGRIEELSAQATEISIRLTLPNDFLFKVDTASMLESLEIRVPMLDEELIAFGLTLPHDLKVQRRTCKVVLREVAARRLPLEIANKPKQGFGIPVDDWVETDFKAQLREELISASTQLPEYFDRGVYEPWIKAFCEGRQLFGVSRQSLYQRIIMLLSLHISLDRKASLDTIVPTPTIDICQEFSHI